MTALTVGAVMERLEAFEREEPTLFARLMANKGDYGDLIAPFMADAMVSRDVPRLIDCVNAMFASAWVMGLDAAREVPR
jgi:hypothetical protein